MRLKLAIAVLAVMLPFRSFSATTTQTIPFIHDGPPGTARSGWNVTVYPQPFDRGLGTLRAIDFRIYGAITFNANIMGKYSDCVGLCSLDGFFQTNGLFWITANGDIQSGFLTFLSGPGKKDTFFVTEGQSAFSHTAFVALNTRTFDQGLLDSDNINVYSDFSSDNDYSTYGLESFTHYESFSGSATIIYNYDARAIAEPTVPAALGFVSRPYSTATAALTIGNAGTLAANSDSLVTTLGALSPGISSTGAPAPIAAGQTGEIAYTFEAADPGIVSGSIELGFASVGTGTDIDLGVRSVDVTATVTEVARAGLSAISGATVTFDPTTGTYLVDYGDVAFGSSKVARLSLSNLIGASAYAERLAGVFIRPFDRDSLDFSGNPFFDFDLAGGHALDFVYGFETSGLSAGVYTIEGGFVSSSRFPGLSDTDLTFTDVVFRANILGEVAAVPEPAIWGLMIAGFGMIGATARRRRDAQGRSNCNVSLATSRSIAIAG